MNIISITISDRNRRSRSPPLKNRPHKTDGGGCQLPPFPHSPTLTHPHSPTLTNTHQHSPTLTNTHQRSHTLSAPFSKSLPGSFPIPPGRIGVITASMNPSRIPDPFTPRPPQSPAVLGRSTAAVPRAFRPAPPRPASPRSVPLRPAPLRPAPPRSAAEPGRSRAPPRYAAVQRSAKT
jgi:hypothetical protein